MYQIANITSARFLNIFRPLHFQGSLLVSIPIESNHFQLNPTSFRQLFIFVHYRNQGTDFRSYEALLISTRVPLHRGTDFNRISVKLWLYKACCNSVRIFKFVSCLQKLGFMNSSIQTPNHVKRVRGYKQYPYSDDENCHRRLCIE